MIGSFGNKLAKDLVEENSSKEVRAFPAELVRICRRKLNMLHAAKALEDLKSPPGNRFEALKGDRKGQYSIRVNDQWRITFKFEQGNAFDVKVEDYHK
jgi:toxin HigB-1